MIELASYRIVSSRPTLTKEEGNDTALYNQVWSNHQKKVIAYLEGQAKAYDADGVNSSFMIPEGSHGQSHFGIVTPGSAIATQYDVSSTPAYKKHLQQQSNDLVTFVEAPSGLQYVAFAAYVPVPHQSNVGDSFRGKLTQQFYTVSHGIESGKALTQGEIDARAQMNETVYNKIADAMTVLKAKHSNYLIDVQERKAGQLLHQHHDRAECRTRRCRV